MFLANTNLIAWLAVMLNRICLVFYRCISGFWGLDSRRSGRLYFNEVVASI